MIRVEGRRPVIEALRSKHGVREVRIAVGVDDSDPIREILDLSGARNVPVKRVGRDDMDDDSAAGGHQGVSADVEWSSTPLEQIIASAASADQSLVVVLDHIEDPQNLGAVARAAEVAGAAGMVVATRRGAPMSTGAFKASAGALAHLPVAEVANIASSLRVLKDAGYWVAGASESADQSAWDSPLEGRIALVLGSEGRGLARLTQETCDFLVRLPVMGKIGSLNVSQAATALIFEWLRRGAT